MKTCILSLATLFGLIAIATTSATTRTVMNINDSSASSLRDTVAASIYDDTQAIEQAAPEAFTPNASSQMNNEWITVDNFSGSGNRNVYLVEGDFGSGNGIYFFRSTDGGSTYRPSGGTLIASSATANVQGAFVSVNPDHSLHVWWYDGPSVKARKSTDQGVTFGAPVTVVTFASSGGINGDLGLTGTTNGGATGSFRTNKFPHVAVNPLNGNIYMAYNDHGTEADKADIFLVQSTDGGATWSAPMRVNDDSTTTDQWHPNVVVSPDGTRLAIFYYSRQEDTATNNLFNYYGRVARISGATLTFAPSFAVSDTQSYPEFGQDSLVISTYMEDYDQAYARAGSFDLAWADNRNDLQSELQAIQPVSVSSAKVHGGSVPPGPCLAPEFCIPMPLSGFQGVECRVNTGAAVSGPNAGHDYELVVNFSTNVTIGPAVLVATNLPCDSMPSATLNPASGSSAVFRVDLHNVQNTCNGNPAGQVLTITLTNVSDGTTMNNVTIPMGVLIGDVNGNGIVDGSDVSQVQSHTRMELNSATFQYDINVSGVIDGNDVSITQSHTRSNLP